jgi:hypothetical protein
MVKAEELIKTMTARPDSADDGVLANDLLREFHHGFPVERLRPLLNSSNEKVVKAAAFIASELGSRAAPLLDTLVGLLHDADARVRSDMIISMITCTTGNDKKEIAGVISMLDDPDWRIRHEVMEFLSRVSLEQLRAGLGHFDSSHPDSAHVPALRWLSSEGATNPDQIISWLRSDNSLKRKYGVVAASRISSATGGRRRQSEGNDEPLVLASSSDSEDVKQFANSMLQMRPVAL